MMAIQTWAKISNLRDIRLLEQFRRTFGQVSPLLARLARERIAELNADEAELSAVVPVLRDRRKGAKSATCKDIAVAVGTGVERCLPPGKASFRDCAFCPEMVVVPPGDFMMGAPQHEVGRRADEAQRRVSIARAFAVGKFAVTREEFSVFVKAAKFKPSDQNCSGRVARAVVQKDRHPVVCVSLRDARMYVAWLSQTVGRPYRLLSEAEYEYAARAGTTTAYWWGNEITRQHAHYSATGDLPSGHRNNQNAAAVPVGTFKANAWGLFDVHGNVWQWTSECNGEIGHRDGSTGIGPGAADCRSAGARSGVLRGGSWRSPAARLRAASRRVVRSGVRSDAVGFRVARAIQAQ